MPTCDSHLQMTVELVEPVGTIDLTVMTESSPMANRLGDRLALDCEPLDLVDYLDLVPDLVTLRSQEMTEVTVARDSGLALLAQD